MKNILIGFLVIGTCGIVNSSPIPENSTPSFQTVSSSTEKSANEAHSTPPGKKEEKEIGPTTELPEHLKSVTESQSGKESSTTVTTANKIETSTLKNHKDESAVTPSSIKTDIKESTPSVPGHKGDPIASSSSNIKQDKESATTPSGYKVESTNPSTTGQKGPTTIKPANGDKEKKPNNNQKQNKTSTAYLDKGKVVIFNGICGPDGCDIEGDIYDELVPLPHAKKQG